MLSICDYKKYDFIHTDKTMEIQLSNFILDSIVNIVKDKYISKWEQKRIHIKKIEKYKES